jgi:hypothetical protein
MFWKFRYRIARMEETVIETLTEQEMEAKELGLAMMAKRSPAARFVCVEPFCQGRTVEFPDLNAKWSAEGVKTAGSPEPNVKGQANTAPDRVTSAARAGRIGS